MEKIGKILKEKRLEKGLTVEAVSTKTRLTTKYINAIEAGDISYFKDDLSYLRYFLRSYCDVLDLDFEDIKPLLQESIDTYTTTFTMQAIKEHEQIEENVAKKTKQISKASHVNVHKKTKKHHKPDLSLITLIGIIVVIVVCLVMAVIYLFPQLNNSDDVKPNDNTPVVEKPKPEVSTDEKDDDKKDENKDNKVTIKQAADIYHFEVLNWKDDDELTLEVQFKTNAWFALNLNNVELNEPGARVYNFDEILTYKGKLKDGNELMLRFGYMGPHIVKVNGQVVTLDPSIISNNNPINIYFTMKGQ